MESVGSVIAIAIPQIMIIAVAIALGYRYCYSLREFVCLNVESIGSYCLLIGGGCRHCYCYSYSLNYDYSYCYSYYYCLRVLL